MSGRSSRAGWEKAPTPPWVYGLVGVLLTLVVVLGIVIFMLVGNGSPGLASATSTPTLPPAGATPSPTVAASVVAVPTDAPSAEVTPGPTPSATPAVTPAPTSAPTSAPTQPVGTPAPSGSTKPTLTAFKGPHTADCSGLNGTQVEGEIHLSWSADNASGVTLAIDDPDPKVGYAAPFGRYPATDAEDVPFSCTFTLTDATGPYHLYTVITDHTTGYWQYRYIKVYQSPKPTPAPTL